MFDFSLSEFLENLDTAGRRIQDGHAYLESVKELNRDTKRKKLEAEQKKMEERRMQSLVAEQRIYDSIMLNKSVDSLLTGMLNKQAKLGTENRKDMPQISAKEVRESSIPTRSLEFVDPKKLKYTQKDSHINKTKAQGIADHWETVGKQPVLISKDNWVIDGHHRVEAAKIKNKWVRVIRIQLPGMKALKAVRKLDK